MSKEAYNKIVSKLERLDEYVLYLRDIQKVNKEQFVSDYHFFGLAERYFHLAIETLLDVGKILIVIEKLERPDENQEIFVVLNRHSVLTDGLTERLVGIANFRNILVHEYGKIDREIVFSKLQKNLADFTDFKKEVVKFLSNL
jgi:uncharacterized protein YutE (UPF0331/DUF86 family)